MFDLFLTVALFDPLACFLTAAAAACRVRACGGHLSGAAVLGCFAGLVPPFVRETILGYGIYVTVHGGVYLASLTAGALVGALAAGWVKRPDRLFYRLEAPALGLMGCIAAARGLRSGAMDLSGALLLGVLCALAGGFVRDAALGDTARLVEERFYATAAALGCMTTVALLYVPDLHLQAWPPGTVAVFAGALVAVAFRLWGRWRGPGE